MKDARVATLTYVDDQERLVSVPMGTQDFDDPGTVWFITDLSSEKVASIRKRPSVNVAYSSDDGWVSLAGRAVVSEDHEKLEQLWDASASAFMSGDDEDSHAGLLEVCGATAEYWEAPGKAAMVVQLVKGVLSDQAPDLGDSGVVPL